MSYKWNPFTGNLDRVPAGSTVTEVEFAQKVAEEFDCLASAEVGDIVIISEAVQERVEVLSSNVYNQLAFGIIIEKISLTRCKVLVSGKVSGGFYKLSGLSPGKALYIDTDGSLTTTVPATGHLQQMGIAIKPDTIFLLPQMNKVVR